MKKVALTLASIAAIATFAPEASAIPAFARQTGMACSACHFQHFPLLNGFGRAFKSGAYTMMGSQGLVEGEALSIPDRVNMAVYTTTFVQSESGLGAGSPGKAPAISTPGTGGEFSLFMGGRASDFAGFIAEAGLGGGGYTTAPAVGALTPAGGIIAGTKMLMLFPVGDARVGLSVHSSQGQGVAYSFETLNTGATGTHKLMGNGGPSGQHLNATSAAQYLGTATAATGASIIANNSSGFINVGLWEMAGNDVVTGANALGLNYERLVYTTDIAGFDMGFGVQHFGGTSTVTNSATLTALGVTGLPVGTGGAGLNNTPNATIIDAQAQGDLAGMSAGLYASYGTAAASTASSFNPFNANSTATATAKTSLNFAGTVEVAKGTTVQAGLRIGNNGTGKSGVTAAGTAVDASGDNAIMIGVAYELAQNLTLSYNATQQSGSAWDSANFAGVEPMGKTATTLLLEALF